MPTYPELQGAWLLFKMCQNLKMDKGNREFLEDADPPNLQIMPAVFDLSQSIFSHKESPIYLLRRILNYK